MVNICWKTLIFSSKLENIHFLREKSFFPSPRRDHLQTPAYPTKTHTPHPRKPLNLFSHRATFFFQALVFLFFLSYVELLRMSSRLPTFEVENENSKTNKKAWKLACSYLIWTCDENLWWRSFISGSNLFWQNQKRPRPHYWLFINIFLL